jgi:2-hydroxychromene-2-carboxylate isomerase
MPSPRSTTLEISSRNHPASNPLSPRQRPTIPPSIRRDASAHKIVVNTQEARSNSMAKFMFVDEDDITTEPPNPGDVLDTDKLDAETLQAEMNDAQFMAQLLKKKKQPARK